MAKPASVGTLEDMISMAEACDTEGRYSGAHGL